MLMIYLTLTARLLNTLFTQPLASSNLKIFKVDQIIEDEKVTFELREIANKIIGLNQEEASFYLYRNGEP